MKRHCRDASPLSWRQLESERMRLLRRAFLRENRAATTHNLTLESATMVRRLRWYQSMLANPCHHTIYLATLFGSFERERTADFDTDGSLAHRALLALRQLADDLTRFLTSWPGLVLGWVPMFLEHDFSSVSACFIPRDAGSHEFGGPSLRRALFEDVQSSRLYRCLECRAFFFYESRMFLH